MPVYLITVKLNEDSNHDGLYEILDQIPGELQHVMHSVWLLDSSLDIDDITMKIGAFVYSEGGKVLINEACKKVGGTLLGEDMNSWLNQRFGPLTFFDFVPSK